MSRALLRVSGTSGDLKEPGWQQGKGQSCSVAILPYLHWQQAKFPSPFSVAEFPGLKELKHRKNYLYKCKPLSMKAKMLPQFELEDLQY